MSAKENQKEQRKKKLALQKKYGQRITIMRQGREAFLQKDYVNAQKKYNEYLGILAGLHDIDDIYKLSPGMFDAKKEVTEMLLISHVYWEIARINEMTPSLGKNFYKALSQFVKFTINQPYQILNAEMLRKYIKKNKKTTPQYPFLNDAYQQIFVQSKKCYIATYCFDRDAIETQTLRQFKGILLRYPGGTYLVSRYYKYSSQIVSHLEHKPALAKLITPLFRAPLRTFARFLKSSIFKA